MRTLILTLLSFISMGALSDGRSEVSLTQWQFSRDKTSWQDVTVPHDWAIDGPFDKKWDLQSVAIVQNGETQATEKSGRSGALPWIGEGYYKTNIHIDKLPEHAELVFDGAMSEPTVSVNGKEAGYWAYGYNAFRIDVTPYLHAGDNLIEVSLKNVEESSRWYPGGGIYRPVKLVTTSKAHLDAWGTYIRTLQADSNQAILSIDTKTIGGEGKVNIRIYDASGAEVANGNTPFVKNPHIWSPETPYLYTAVIELLQQDVVVDKLIQKFGIRTIAITPERGFMLNGVSRKFKGVCLHHDLGPLGAAVNRAALERQVRILKDMGCDAIRTSHNMPSTMQLEVCDSMGMMVMAESFDMWIYPKCKNGYARFFNEWSDRDMENLVLRSRNHPSIVMWSIGNEIPEQWNEEGREISRRLQDICHRLDPSRPVTQGMDRADGATKTGFMQVMDVPGFNYRVHLYDEYIGQLPQKFILGSETGSTISSRGVYYFPVEVTDHPYHDDGQAHGLCFSVPSGIKIPPSLVNIYKEIQTDIGTLVHGTGDLTAWAQQGVLLLNATLTVRAHQAGSHQRQGWEQFTDAVISVLNRERTGLVFMLWGSYAISKRNLIDTQRHLVLTSSHPSPLSAHRGFFGNHHFSLTNNYLLKNGQTPIIW